MGVGYDKPGYNVAAQYPVSIAGAILGGGLLPVSAISYTPIVVSIAGAILGGGLRIRAAGQMAIFGSFNRGGDSWGWATD